MCGKIQCLLDAMLNEEAKDWDSKLIGKYATMDAHSFSS